MPHTAEDVLANALSLTAEERGKVAASLIESLDEQVDDGADEAWAAEIRRRLDEIDAGKVELIPWEEARRIIRGDR
jgi:putative addiction module component (TIGR02574 family)